MRILRGVPKCELARGAAPFRERRARLHRVRNQPLLDDALLDDEVGLRERRVDVAAADRPVERFVVRNIRMQLRRARFVRRHRIDDRGQRLVVDVDELERVVRLIRRFGDDDADDVADVADEVARAAAVCRHLQVRVGQQPRARHRLQRVNFRAGEDGDDAGRALRARRVDACDARVCMRAAQHRGVHHVGQREIVGVGRRARDEPRIFAALEA